MVVLVRDNDGTVAIALGEQADVERGAGRGRIEGVAQGDVCGSEVYELTKE